MLTSKVNIYFGSEQRLSSKVVLKNCEWGLNFCTHSKSKCRLLCELRYLRVKRLFKKKIVLWLMLWKFSKSVKLSIYFKTGVIRLGW